MIYFEAQSEKYTTIGPGSFDDNVIFGRFEVERVQVCRDKFETAVRDWASAQQLHPALVDPTEFTSTIHVPTRKPVEYFELTYWVDMNARRLRITVSVIDAKGSALEPKKAYVDRYELTGLGQKLRGVLECAG